jgi:hypothetical protein
MKITPTPCRHSIKETISLRLAPKSRNIEMKLPSKISEPAEKFLSHISFNDERSSPATNNVIWSSVRNALKHSSQVFFVTLPSVPFPPPSITTMLSLSLIKQRLTMVLFESI